MKTDPNNARSRLMKNLPKITTSQSTRVAARITKVMKTSEKSQTVSSTAPSSSSSSSLSSCLKLSHQNDDHVYVIVAGCSSPSMDPYRGLHVKKVRSSIAFSIACVFLFVIGGTTMFVHCSEYKITTKSLSSVARSKTRENEGKLGVSFVNMNEMNDNSGKSNILSQRLRKLKANGEDGPVLLSSLLSKSLAVSTDEEANNKREAQESVSTALEAQEQRQQTLRYRSRQTRSRISHLEGSSFSASQLTAESFGSVPPTQPPQTSVPSSDFIVIIGPSVSSISTTLTPSLSPTKSILPYIGLQMESVSPTQSFDWDQTPQPLTNSPVLAPVLMGTSSPTSVPFILIDYPPTAPPQTAVPTRSANNDNTPSPISLTAAPVTEAPVTTEPSVEPAAAAPVTTEPSVEPAAAAPVVLTLSPTQAKQLTLSPTVFISPSPGQVPDPPIPSPVVDIDPPSIVKSPTPFTATPPTFVAPVAEVPAPNQAITTNSPVIVPPATGPIWNIEPPNTPVIDSPTTDSVPSIVNPKPQVVVLPSSSQPFDSAPVPTYPTVVKAPVKDVENDKLPTVQIPVAVPSSKVFPTQSQPTADVRIPQSPTINENEPSKSQPNPDPMVPTVVTDDSIIDEDDIVLKPPTNSNIDLPSEGPEQVGPTKSPESNIGNDDNGIDDNDNDGGSDTVPIASPSVNDYATVVPSKSEELTKETPTIGDNGKTEFTSTPLALRVPFLIPTTIAPTVTTSPTTETPKPTFVLTAFPIVIAPTSSKVPSSSLTPISVTISDVQMMFENVIIPFSPFGDERENTTGIAKNSEKETLETITKQWFEDYYNSENPSLLSSKQLGVNGDSYSSKANNQRVRKYRQSLQEEESGNDVLVNNEYNKSEIRPYDSIGDMMIHVNIIESLLADSAQINSSQVNKNNRAKYMLLSMNWSMSYIEIDVIDINTSSIAPFDILRAPFLDEQYNMLYGALLKDRLSSIFENVSLPLPIPTIGSDSVIEVIEDKNTSSNELPQSNSSNATNDDVPTLPNVSTDDRDSDSNSTSSSRVPGWAIALIVVIFGTVVGIVGYKCYIKISNQNHSNDGNDDSNNGHLSRYYPTKTTIGSTVGSIYSSTCNTNNKASRTSRTNLSEPQISSSNPSTGVDENELAGRNPQQLSPNEVSIAGDGADDVTHATSPTYHSSMYIQQCQTPQQQTQCVTSDDVGIADTDMFKDQMNGTLKSDLYVSPKSHELANQKRIHLLPYQIRDEITESAHQNDSGGVQMNVDGDKLDNKATRTVPYNDEAMKDTVIVIDRSKVSDSYETSDDDDMAEQMIYHHRLQQTDPDVEGAVNQNDVIIDDPDDVDIKEIYYIPSGCCGVTLVYTDIGIPVVHEICHDSMLRMYGLKAGDFIIAIDDYPTDTLPAQKITQLLNEVTTPITTMLSASFGHQRNPQVRKLTICRDIPFRESTFLPVTSTATTSVIPPNHYSTYENEAFYHEGGELSNEQDQMIFQSDDCSELTMTDFSRNGRSTNQE